MLLGTVKLFQMFLNSAAANLAHRCKRNSRLGCKVLVGELGEWLEKDVSCWVLVGNAAGI